MWGGDLANAILLLLTHFVFKVINLGESECQYMIHMLLGLFRRTAKRGMCVCPQKNIHASRAHSQYTHLLTIMRSYLAQYSTALEECVQYY